MANEQSGSPLRRWRQFYGAFGAIDGAIEAASGEPRAAFQDVRVRIVRLLRAATDDDGVAEQLCAVLDDAMEESLKTLLLVVTTRPVLPAHRHGAPAASTTDDLVRAAVAALANHHGCPRIRSLAGDVVRRWKMATTAVKEELDQKKQPAKMMLPTATAEEHEKKMHVPPPPEKMLRPIAAAGGEVQKKKLQVPAKTLPSAAAATTVEEREKKLLFAPVKMTLPVSGARRTVSVCAQRDKMEVKKPVVVVAQGEKKMETTKRKLREGYEEAFKIKLRHAIQTIDDEDASKMFEQSQRKIRRGPARCRISTGVVRRSLLPSLQLF